MSPLSVLDPETADTARTVFDGCTKRAELAAFMQAFAIEQRVRGFAYGAVVGVVGAVALAVYLRSKGHV